MQALEARKVELRAQIATASKALAEVRPLRDQLLLSLREKDANSVAEASEIEHCRSAQRGEDRRVIRKSSARYLLSSASVDAGSLRLYWDRLTFSGWRGNCVIGLGEISAMEAGVSHLPMRSGAPLFEKWWPGAVQEKQTVLLSLASDDGSRQRAVLAGLPQESHWLDAIQEAQAAYPQRLDSRTIGASAIDAAARRKAMLDQEIAELQGQIQRLDVQIKSLEAAGREAERELALPDWEHRTIQLHGKNLNQQLERELRSASADGWELVSTASPRRDELITTLKRVRRV